MAKNNRNSKTIKIKNKYLIFFLILLLGINAYLFREMIFAGKVPIAFDYGVYNYQPWKIDYEDELSLSPKRIGHDDIRIFYPQRKFIIESLKKGQIPFWNPYEFIGNVSLANSQTAVFYPPFILFLLLSQKTAWSLLSFTVPIIAGLGTFLFIRILKLDNIAAIFGAIIFAFSETIITRTQDGLVAGHSLIWLPWSLYAIKVIDNKKRIGILILMLSLIFSMLAGWFQFTFYVYLISFSFSLFLFYNSKKHRNHKQLFFLMLIFFLTILFTSFHWFPAIEALKYSPRGLIGTPIDFSQKHLMPIRHLITLIIPNFFGHLDNNTYFGASEYKEGVIAIGLSPFLISLFSIFSRKKKSIEKYFLVVFIVSLLFGLNTFIAKAIINFNIPLLSTFLPNRILALASFALSILAAYGYQNLRRHKIRNIKLIYITVLGLFLFFYFIMINIYLYERFLARYFSISLFSKGIESFIRISIKESLIPFGLLIILLFTLFRLKKITKAFIAVVFITTIISQIYRAGRYIYFSDASNEFPTNPLIEFLQEKSKEGYYRFISLSYSRITSNIPSFYNLYFPEGVNAMYPSWYGEFSQFYRSNLASINQNSRIEVALADEIEKPDIRLKSRWRDPKTINLLSHLSIKYIIVPRDGGNVIPPEELFEKVFSYKWHTVYEYKYAFPRAYFVPNANFIQDKNISIQRIFHPLFFSNNEVVLAESNNLLDKDFDRIYENTTSNIDLVKKHKSECGSIQQDPYKTVKNISSQFVENLVLIENYDINRISLKANVNENGYIILTDSYFPGWKAEVDGEKEDIYRANYAFRAVPVDKGEHIITMYYKPASFYKGIKISQFTIIILITAALSRMIYRLRLSI